MEKPAESTGSRQVAVASVLANFYPKFENESEEMKKRVQMEAAVASGSAALEVSVKHSGSLFLWAGAQRGAFSKNSYGNEYTAVGIWVLSETLRRQWGEQALQKQQELSDCLQRERLVVAMELVTAVLGDHGQRPRQDYVVVTAVVDLHQQPVFYGTPDVLRFCRTWRLPSNSYYLFDSESSVSSFMAAYMALSEEGTAQTVEETLSQIASLHVPGTADHQTLQGDIMEGLVARLVSPATVASLREVQASHPLLPDQHATAAGAGTRLREVFAQHSNDKERIAALLEEAGPAMCTRWQWQGRKGTIDDSHEGDSAVLSAFLSAVPADAVTASLQALVREVRGHKLPVRFKPWPMPFPQGPASLELAGETGSSSVRWAGAPGNGGGEALPAQGLQRHVITVHAYADSAFPRYRKIMNKIPNLWPLFRGFFFEVDLLALSPAAATQLDAACHLDKTQRQMAVLQLAPGTSQVAEVEPVMLKMKFLTYKLRTFLIRNGLGILFRKDSGVAAYKQHCTRLLKAWGTSPKTTVALMKFCHAWAQHVLPLGQAPSLYLDVAEPFIQEYAKRSSAHARLVGAQPEEASDSRSADIPDEDDEEDDDMWQTDGAVGQPTRPDGLLVFFPGIPGCAKSALCAALLESGDLGDGRQLDTLMGDTTTGKYWRVLAARRKKHPKVVTLADKNAPNEDVWTQIEVMAADTSAQAVPVVPASAGEDSNPFDPETMAVFMHRVLQRVDHPGHLDRSTRGAAVVLLQFQSLYEGSDRASFELELRTRFGSLVSIPVLRPVRAPLPEELLDHIRAGRHLYQRFRRSEGRGKYLKVQPLESRLASEFLLWESRARDLLAKHSQHIASIQVPFQEVVAAVHEQLSRIACGRMEAVPGGSAFSSRVRLAEISIPGDALLAILYKIAADDLRLAEFLAGKETEIANKAKKAHVTLAHKNVHGVTAVAARAPLVGTAVEVRLVDLLVSPRCAAIAVDWTGMAETSAIGSENSFPHITVWTWKKVLAKEANDLPSEEVAGKATRIQLPPGISLTGRVALR